MIITLLRHGEVEEAYHRCYNGHNDIALSAKGVTEALQLDEHFSQHSFDAIFSSDLKRCRQTVEQITHSSYPPITFTEKLREKSWGRHEGMTFDAITKRDGLIYQDFLQWINALDGEPYDAYIKRIKTFFTKTLPLTPYNNVLVVTHAGVIRVLMHILQEIPLQEAFGIDFPYGAYTTLDTNSWEFGETQCV